MSFWSASLFSLWTVISLSCLGQTGRWIFFLSASFSIPAFASLCSWLHLKAKLSWNFLNSILLNVHQSPNEEELPDGEFSCGVFPPSHQICSHQAPHLPLTAGYLNILFSIAPLQFYPRTFLYLREDRKFVDMFLSVAAASSVTSLISLLSSLDPPTPALGSLPAAPLSKRVPPCSTGPAFSTGPSPQVFSPHAPSLVSAWLPSDTPESGLPLSKALWAP